MWFPCGSLPLAALSRTWCDVWTGAAEPSCDRKPPRLFPLGLWDFCGKRNCFNTTGVIVKAAPGEELWFVSEQRRRIADPPPPTSFTGHIKRRWLESVTQGSLIDSTRCGAGIDPAPLCVVTSPREKHVRFWRNYFSCQSGGKKRRTEGCGGIQGFELERVIGGQKAGETLQQRLSHLP